MSMLAGPRRKQKVINLRAKNNAWSNDSNKFGQRMLEKMGWSSGKGLGAKENGIVEHVVARYKNDEHGLGFNDKNDQWTKHEDEFNSLLANLSGNNNEEKLHSGISLEDKSKKSKARIHYHKFTRGKDLSRYSEKDLANIFGKKCFKNEEKQEESQDKTTTSEKVFTEKGSMEDYFKSKLAAFKTKSNITPLYDEDSVHKDSDYGFQGFSGTNGSEDTNELNFDFGIKNFSCNENDEYNETNIETKEKAESECTQKSKKKKKNKNKVKELAETEINLNIANSGMDNVNIQQDPDLEHSTTDNTVKTKNKKNNKEIRNFEEEQPLKKKKKKSKEEPQEILEINIDSINHCLSKKKKKRKNYV